jgi:hypothetical protein
MRDKHEQARDKAEEGLDRLIEGDKSGRKLIEEAKRIDPTAVAELVEEIEREKQEAERYASWGA